MVRVTDLQSTKYWTSQFSASKPCPSLVIFIPKDSLHFDLSFGIKDNENQTWFTGWKLICPILGNFPVFDTLILFSQGLRSAHQPILLYIGLSF